jgi:predicted transcriptional regulator YdeE
MDYEIVQLEEKVVAGLKTRTSNGDPNMSNCIGGLWQMFYEKGVYQRIPNKKNHKSIGLYTNYEGQKGDAYDVLVCCEVETLEGLEAGTEGFVIPDGKYAKFVVKGNAVTACMEFWMKLCELDLNRKYGVDFEEYQNADMENAEIHMYISLK